MSSRGYFGVAVYNPKHETNVGLLWRTAVAYDAAFLATVGGTRYKRQHSDTPDSQRHTPLHHYTDIDDLIAHLPHECDLVGVEIAPTAVSLDRYAHRPRALYLLGAEDHGLPAEVMRRCRDIVTVPTQRDFSLNVSVAGSIVLSHRHMARQTRRRADLVPIAMPKLRSQP